MNCPACDQLLRALDYEGITIQTCDSCGGEWLAAVELKHIVHARQVRFTEEECRALLSVPVEPPIKLTDHDRRLSCPQCNARMEIYNYAGDTGIVLDRCPSCRGIWMDSEELENVQRIFEGWEHRVDDLPDDLAKYGPRLKQIAREISEENKPNVSRFAIVNALIGRVLDVMWEHGIG